MASERRDELKEGERAAGVSRRDFLRAATAAGAAAAGGPRRRPRGLPPAGSASPRRRS